MTTHRTLSPLSLALRRSPDHIAFCGDVRVRRYYSNVWGIDTTTTSRHFSNRHDTITALQRLLGLSEDADWQPDMRDAETRLLDAILGKYPCPRCHTFIFIEEDYCANCLNDEAGANGLAASASFQQWRKAHVNG